MHYIDFHCDTLMMFGRESGAAEAAPSLYQNDKSVDLVRMKAGGCAAQFFATFMPPKVHMQAQGIDDEVFRSRLYNGLMDTIREHADLIGFARNFEEYKANRNAGRISAFLTFEDGRMVEGSHEKLAAFYDMGYRLISFTWNFPNCFGYPNSSDPQEMQKGLTPFGMEAVEQMNRLGMIIDVSHLSDGGFYDVARTTQKPFVASHSNARALTPHQRNLTDDMIRLLAEKGGVMGINFAPEFIGETIHDTASTVKRIGDHVQHIATIAGIETVALGSDWDGIRGDLEVSSPLDIYTIFDELSRRGFSDDAIEKFAHGNAERILRDVL